MSARTLLPSKQEITASLPNFPAQNRNNLEQHRRQRTNVSEELALEREKRANKRDQINGAMGTAAGAVGLIGGIAGTAALIKAGF